MHDISGQIINQKYHLITPLSISGSGMSTVYQARDIQTGNWAAVKLFRGGVISTYFEDIIRFKKECSIVSKLHHPHIVKIQETGEYAGHPYLVMELLNGATLADVLRNGKQFTEPETLTIIRQLTQTLNYIHRHGVIHRDLKPGNIFMVNPEREIHLKLLDFGVALILEPKQIQGTDRIAGTFGYMSPEATGIFNRRIDERSDLYSLGAVFYHLLTGQRPFPEKDLNRLLYQQVAMVPPRPETIQPGIPGVLQSVVMKLLAKDPDLRYQSAAGLLTDLERYEQGERFFVIGERDPKIKLTYRTKLLGREAELAKIKALCNKARGGKGCLCLISGEAGIGKSRLVEELRGYVYELNGLFIKGRCLNHPKKMPYQPFRDASDEYLNKLTKSEPSYITSERVRLQSFLGDLAAVITRLNPRFSNLLNIQQDQLSPLDEPGHENQRFLMVTANFFCRLPAPGSFCVILLDDLQWADTGSLHLLEEIVSKVADSNLLVLGTYRDNEIISGHGLEKVKTEAWDNSYVLEEIQLVPFQPVDVNQLVAEILGGKETPIATLAGYVMNQSKGNPLFAINILRELVEHRFISWEENGWKEDWEKIKGTPLASTLLDLIMQRIENLSPGQANLLSQAAVIGKEFPLELLYPLTHFGKTKVIDFIHQSIEEQLLEYSTDKGKVQFAHDRIRDAFYQKLTPAQLKQIHLRIAGVIAMQYQGREDEVLFELAHHYYAGGDAENSLKYIIPAAIKAKESYANEEAIKYYRIGIGLLEQQGQKGNHLWIQANHDLLDILLNVGKNDEATDISLTLLPFVQSPLIQARIYKKMGVSHFYMKQNDLASFEEIISKGLKLLNVNLPRTNHQVFWATAKEIVIHLFHHLVWRFPTSQKNKPLSEITHEIFLFYTTLLRVYVLYDSRKLICNLLKMLNLSETWLGKTHGIDIILRAYSAQSMIIPLLKRTLKYQQYNLNLHTKLQDEWGTAQSLQHIGITYSWQGFHSKSIQYLSASRDKFGKIGDVWGSGTSFMMLGNEFYYISDYPSALEVYQQAMPIFQRIKNCQFETMGIQALMANCFTEIGAYPKAGEYLNRLFEPSKNNQFVHFSVLLYLGYLELEQQRFDPAISQFEQSMEIMQKNNFFKEFTTLLYIRLSEAHLNKYREQVFHSGRIDAGQTRIKIHRLCRNALRLSKPWPNRYGIALRVTAGYWSLTKMNRRAEKHYRKSIHQLKKIGIRYELGKAYYEYGNFLNATRRPNAATEQWRLAAKTFREIGANTRLTQCLQLLNINSKPVAETTAMELTSKKRFQYERRFNTVFTTSHFLSSILEPDELLGKIIDSVMELTGAERGILMLYPEDGEMQLGLKAIRNISRVAFKGHEFAISRSIITKIETEKKPVIIIDAILDEELNNESSVILNDIRSVIGAPIMTNGRLLGVIYLDNRLLGGLFDEDDLEVLDMVANQAGVCIENARLYRRSQDYARQLEQSQTEIAGWNQALQKRVQERTRELQEKNNELEAKNQELMALNQQLQEYSTTIAELAIAEERNRLAHDIHDSLGQLMALSISQLSACGNLCLKSPPDAKGKLEKIVTLLREGLAEIRHTIIGLIPEKLKADNLVEALQSLITDYRNFGLTVDFSVEGKVDGLEPRLLDAVYRACQEALTNSIKHGQANEVMILLRFLEDRLKVYISDDGCGCKTIHKGLGLTGMEQRIKNLGGELVLGSDGESGFNLRIEIPLAPNIIKSI